MRTENTETLTEIIDALFEIDSSPLGRLSDA